MELSNSFAPNRTVYSNIKKDRYLYFDQNQNRWEIGTETHSLSSEIYTTTGEIRELRVLVLFALLIRVDHCCVFLA